VGQRADKTGPETGRFRPGKSGNPAGRPKGRKNRATLICQALLEGEAERIARAVVDKALAGDPACLRLCLERLLSPLKERPITIPMPTVSSATDVPSAISAVLGSVTQGDLLPSEGAELATLIDTYRKAVEIEDLTNRVRNLERELLKVQR
jgi:hypothetical protein